MRNLSSAACVLLFAVVMASAQEPKTAYLFTYFTGNQPQEEQIRFAVSRDGMNYYALNNDQPVIGSDTIARKGAVRDPHILRGEDGYFYMVVTDMRSREGWSSNRGLVLLRSNDLVNWTHSAVHFPEKWNGKFADVTRVWAPQTIYDKAAGRYMVYFSILTSREGDHDTEYYCYANDDFTDLTAPQVLYDRGKSTIDADIIYKDGWYHMFFKTEGNGNGIMVAKSRSLTDNTWSTNEVYVDQNESGVEGSSVFELLDGKGYVLMYDVYTRGYYEFCHTTDLENFELMKRSYSFDFHPRHGTIITITEAELNRLYAKWGMPDAMSGKTYQQLQREKGYNNPVLPDFHADPEVLYSEKTKRYYIYSTTDGVRGWGGHAFSAFSSKDLTNWQDEGTVLDLKTSQVPWANGNAWAPAIIERKIKGKYKYYLYYSGQPTTNGSGKAIGVAISDSPTGPFIDHGTPIITKSPTGRGQQIDVDVFYDKKTGKHYLYWGNGYMAGAELNDDLCSIKEETLKVMTPRGGTLQDYAYREAPYVFERKGTYYFLWSVDDTGSPNYHVAYGTSSSPLGDITVATSPIILQQDPTQHIYGTAHNSIVKDPKKDEWYIVYHRINRAYLNKEPGIHRETCIDRMHFSADGAILPVRPTQEGIHR